MSDDDILTEAKERLKLCMSADDEDRTEALADLHFIAGEQWDEESVRQRDLDGRPHLTMNNLPSIIHQVTNDVRQNRQSIHVHPVDDSGDIEVAEVIEGLIRHIEYDSSADSAYDKALENAVSIGFGFFRLITEYSADDSFDQDIKIKRVRNPFTVYLDPNAQEADASDMRFAFVTSKTAKDVFKAEYPRATASYDSIIPGLTNDVDWIGPDYVRVCEYYRVEEESATLTRMSDGTTRWADDKQPVQPGVYPMATRTSKRRKIVWRKITAREVLEEAEVPFKWIPIFPVYGDEIDLDGKVQRVGLIRNARDPVVAFNYWMTSATEEVAMRTKTPFIGALGQFEGVEDDWDQANQRSFGRLEYNPVTIEGTLAPPPQRQPMADTPSGNIAMMMLARDNVKAVTGIYDASLGNKSNESSGVAITARQHQGDIANFHFSDNLTRAIRHMGRCIVSGIPRVYDTQRIVRVLGHDGKADTAPVNKPLDPPEQDEETGAIKTVLNDLTVGTYDVVVSTGPAYDTLRAEAADSMIGLAKVYPEMMQVAGDKIVRSMDWPDAQDIADRLAKALPPGLADENKDEKAPPVVQTPNGPVPLEQAAQMIGQMDHTLQAMQGEMEKFEAGLQKAEMDNAARIEVAKIQAGSNADITELNGMIKLLLAGQAPMLAHQAAVVAAADPAHPDAPAPIAQGMEQAPAQVEAAQQATQAETQPETPAEPEPKPKPTRKVLKITSPSGQIYHGEFSDAPDEEEPA